MLQRKKTNKYVDESGLIKSYSNNIIVCLGNPGYEWTRHNVGADLMKFCISNLSKKKIDYNLFFVFFPGFFSFVYLCPDIMNICGNKIHKAYQNLNCENLIVIVDDLDTKFGELKTSFGVSSGGHNGVKSIINSFGHNRFWKIKIGIGRPDNDNVSEFVLSKFSNEEMEKIHSLQDKLYNSLGNIWTSLLEKKQ